MWNVVEAFYVIVKTDCETDGALHSTSLFVCRPRPARAGSSELGKSQAATELLATSLHCNQQ